MYIRAVLKNEATGFSETSVTIHMTLAATAHKRRSMYIRKADSCIRYSPEKKSGRDNRQSSLKISVKVKKGKVHPITGHENPKGE
jgi:hypothetical protein